MSLILFLSGISMGRYFRKSLAKNGGSIKDIKRGSGHIGGLVYRRRGGGGGEQI